MSEQTGTQPGMVNNTGVPPTGQVPAAQALTPQQVVQPVASPVPATLPPAPQALVVPPTPSQIRKDNPNVDMDRQFNHFRGELKARATEWQTWQGQAEQVNRTLAQDLALAQQTATQAQEQLQHAQGFEAQATQAQSLALQNDRLARLIRYPVILQQGVVQQVTDDQGQVQNMTVNPYLDLLMSSNLQGDNFEAAVQRLASSLPSQQNVPAGTIPQQVQPPVAPQQPVALQQQVPLGQFNQAAALVQALPNVGPGVPLNQGLAQQPGMPSMLVTPPVQPIISAQQRVAQLELQRDEASDSGQFELFRQLEDQVRAAKRELSQ